MKTLIQWLIKCILTNFDYSLIKYIFDDNGNNGKEMSFYFFQQLNQIHHELCKNIWQSLENLFNTSITYHLGSTKAAMDMFTKSLALELGPHKVSYVVSQQDPNYMGWHLSIS